MGIVRSYVQLVKKVLNLAPGKRFGEFRFLPYLFIMGAALEFTMIKWHVGKVNFYETFKKRRAVEIALMELEEEEMEQLDKPPA